MSCPLCDHDRSRPSWLGSTFYRGAEFPYVECLRCGSLFCDPMPGHDTLAAMYGPAYLSDVGTEDAAVEDAKQPARVVEWLRGRARGTFVDYGCGDGSLLAEAEKLGWRCVGVEFEKEVAAEVKQRTGIAVVSDPRELSRNPPADALHLGDVIEHLTDLNSQMPAILKLIEKGGHLLAQGPLENNASLFTLAIRAARRLRPGRRTEMAPYHVLLATADGQRELFRRFGLEEVEYRIHEVAWPAPNTISWSDLARPRSVTLFALRRCSQVVSALRPARWGNRYFYVGRWPGGEQSP